MDFKDDLSKTLSSIVSILQSTPIKFHLTGGLISSFYGEPRFTQDIDIVIKIDARVSLDAFISKLSKKFFMDPETIQDAFSKKTMFQALDQETMLKVDFHVGGMIELEFERSVTKEILPGILVPITSREDAILSKLMWIKQGSHKSKQDAKMMIKLADQIDDNYLDRTAQKLGVRNILSQLREELG